MVDPSIMCRKHLLGEHVELHMLVAHLKLGRRIDGYVKNNCTEPNSIESRHRELEKELLKRGYNHNSPLTQPVILNFQHPEAKVNVDSALIDLVSRCKECSQKGKLNV